MSRITSNSPSPQPSPEGRGVRTNLARRFVSWPIVAILFLAVLPLIPVGYRSPSPEEIKDDPKVTGHLLMFEDWLSSVAQRKIGLNVADLFIFAIAALGLNVVIGYTGLLHLGIAAFMGIGAYLTGILTIPGYPFQWGFFATMLAATLGAAGAGVMLGAPTLRLRGDYLALVTLGFGQIAKDILRNLEEITGGTKALGPIPSPTPSLADGGKWDWAGDYRYYYYLCLIALIVVLLVLRNLEKSRIGREWMALREDELAATCMGLNATRVKLTAFALGAGLAGLAGFLSATKLTNTNQPDAYDFNRSITFLCCVILGGLGSLRGAVAGVFLLLGFDTILAPILDSLLQNAFPNASQLLTFKNWRLLIFGVALILTMRFRPEGLFPSRRIQEELHSE